MRVLTQVFSAVCQLEDLAAVSTHLYYYQQYMGLNAIVA